ncbi:FkbM family methyltransferase [Piscinibacter sakaiensis]|uniref:Methyltransferase, FkbM family domain protein n=1 Tax=Piscinibacter sakaiensis TaxID=1547922 RepID=A0A0K8NTD7_PISS1|nr:FkbM family methyltransferase [Piscinibacter sakaiensis]GAP33661.1 methyltransferase, FkbM family domain protein [Piscinibacter sakaiensis]
MTSPEPAATTPLLRALRAVVSAPPWLDPLKLPLVAAGVALQEWRPFHPPAGPLRCEAGFWLAGGARASMLNRVVAYRGLFEPGLTSAIASIVQPGDHVVDVGANAGYFSLLLADRVGPEGRVLAVEAAPGNVRRLHANLAANPTLVPRVEVVHAAASDREGVLGFDLSPRNDMHGRLAGAPDVPPRRDWRRIEVPAQRMQRLLGPAPQRWSFVKVDIEGAEPQVLPDLLAHCSHERLCLALELKPPHIAGCVDRLAAAGLHLYDLGNDYRWLLNRGRPPALCPVAPEQLRRRRRMVDLIASRQPLAPLAHPLPR